jgi:putative Mn2+ efflux pump MntP
MIAVFILCVAGLGLTLFYIMYRQVFSRIVNNNIHFLSHLIMFPVIYTLMTAAGYLLATSLLPLLSFSGHWISMGVFFFLGLKMYRSIIKNKAQNWTFDTTQLKVLFLFSLSNGFDAFFAGIGLGLFAIFQPFYALIFAAGMMMFVLLAWMMARRESATLSVWLFATLGTSLLGMNTIVILIVWLFF